MKIEGKVVVITGGASGLGMATAIHLVEQRGARVAIFDVNEVAGQALVARLGPDKAVFARTDVTDEASVQTAVDSTIEALGAIHVCINCAAIGSPVKVLGKDHKATPLARFAQVTAVNLVGVFNVMSKCVEQMVKNPPESNEERGVVINISSGAAYDAQIGQMAYAATKAGVIGLNSPAARELGALGVRVNAIAPGLFNTPLLQALDEQIVASLLAQIEAPKRFGEMAEFAHCCDFLIENAYVNGETIRLDAASRLRAR